MEMEIMESGGELMIRSNEERIYVSVRLRPLNDKEILSNDVSDWECINDDTIVYKNVSQLALEKSMYPTAYTFDRVFSSDCSTREVYEHGAKDVVISVVRGMNATVFTYGQTSSGKTYTMTGITEYAIADIYEYIHNHPEREFILKFSAMEIYNESVRDLLSTDSTPLRLLDDPERGTIVDKLTEEILSDWNHVTDLLSACHAQRQIGETSLNEMSSRSHQIIRLTIESSSHELLGRDNASTLAAAVVWKYNNENISRVIEMLHQNFVDLAGSERASQSLSAGKRLKEGCHINRSLLTLGTIIRKLSKESNGHIPYRDSKLTRILQTSLGGNARTAIICTMSPARSHVDQSRNTLLFASCAKEVTTNAQVNVVMSDKALVKHLQKKLTRLETQLRSGQSNVVPSNYSAVLREKDEQIEKLEKEIKDLILQRDIAQSEVQEFLQMLGDDASSITHVGLGHYPHLRVQNSPDTEIQKQDTSILADPLSLDVDATACSDGHSKSSSEDHLVKVPFFDDNFAQNYASPRILLSSSISCGSDSDNGWEDIIEKQSNGTSEDLCREVHCIETEELSNRVHVNVDGENLEVKDDNGVKEDKPLEIIMPSMKGQEQISASVLEHKESLTHSPVFNKEKDFSSIQYLDIASLENLSLAHNPAKDSIGARSSNLNRSKSCEASIIMDAASLWFKAMEYIDSKPAVGSERESERCLSKIYTLNLSRKDFQPPLENALDIDIECPGVKFSTDEDSINSTPDMREKVELQTAQETNVKPEKDIAPKADDSPKKNVKDVGLDPMEDEVRGLTSWPVEFKRLQREIIELWHACNVSLVHRTYFFLLFQGDPSDAIYLEVEIRRMKFLKDKFSRGDKTIVNGKRLTLSSSAKALRQERRMLSEQMTKKFSEQEREILFVEWGIGLNTKLRRLQLANSVWTKTDEINHITDSAFLVAKLVGFIEPGQAPNKKMLGVNFAPQSSTGICTFKRSLVSLL